MIYVDMLGHLISDKSLDELHKFARSMQLRRSWFQDKKDHPHYDLCKWDPLQRRYVISVTKIAEARRRGAVYLYRNSNETETRPNTINFGTEAGRTELLKIMEKVKTIK